MEIRDGIILVDKPAGMTSHDVVNYIRRTLKFKRVGHTGILDPGATGLLVMLLGKGTLFSSFLVDMSKRYISRFEFGATTDTYDSDGKILTETDPGELTRDEFESHLSRFIGEIEQTVPPYSAAKKDGVPFYKLARKGKEVTLRHKVVTIKDIKIIEFKWPEVALDIQCSTGTYVRSIAYELGQNIGCGAYLKKLRRTEIGPFSVSSAITLDEIAKVRDLSEIIRPLKQALPSNPLIRIKPQYYGDILNGRPFCKKYVGEFDYNGDGGIMSLLMGPDDKVLALARLNMHWRAIASLGPSEIMGTYVRVINEGHIGS